MRHLCLPLEYDPRHPYLCPQDPRTEPGEPLWEARYGRPEIELMKQQIAHPEAQLQQNPRAGGGEIVDVRRFRYYTDAERPRAWDMLFASYDLPGRISTFGERTPAVGSYSMSSTSRRYR